MICVSRGPAFSPCGWPNASGGERMAATPAPRTFLPLRRDKIKRPASPPELRVMIPATRGRSVAHTSDRGNVDVRPSRGRATGGAPTPALIVPASKPRSYAPCRSTQPTSGPRSFLGPLTSLFRENRGRGPSKSFLGWAPDFAVVVCFANYWLAGVSVVPFDRSATPTHLA
jgi:hypothetical protein